MDTANTKSAPLEPTTYLRPELAAEYCCLSASTLSRLRIKGGGPPYVKLGRAVRYPQDQLVEWLESRIQRNTSNSEVAA